MFYIYGSVKLFLLFVCFLLHQNIQKVHGASQANNLQNVRIFHPDANLKNFSEPNNCFNISCCKNYTTTKNLGDMDNFGRLNCHKCKSCRNFKESVRLDASNYYSAIPPTEIDVNDVYIGGLFDMAPGKEQELTLSDIKSVLVAIDGINKRHFLPNIRLKLVENFTKCDPGVGTDALYNLLYHYPRIIMVITGACSEVTEILAEIVPFWNLILISYASTSPVLSEREKYPTFFRLTPTDLANNPARGLVLKHFGWKIAATLYENKKENYLVINGLIKTLEQYNISVSTSLSFRQKRSEIVAKLKILKESDVRILIGCFTEQSARQVLCEAYKQGLCGRRYVWIIIGDFMEQWWRSPQDTGCTTQELDMAADGHFSVASFHSTNRSHLSTYQDFISEYQALNGTLHISPFATNAFDTIWTMANALKTFLASRDVRTHWISNSIPGQQNENTTTALMDIISQHNFQGLSGSVSFNGPDRKATAAVMQCQGGVRKIIAVYQPETETLNFDCTYCVKVLWKDNRIPRDRVVVVLHLELIERETIYIIGFFCVLGIVSSFIFLAFNIHHRNTRYIKLSSPTLNNVALSGCIFVYCGILLLGLDDRWIQPKLFSIICPVRVFTFAAGFSLAFGAMFTKTYRVHKIFTRATRGLVKNKLLKDQQLLVVIGGLLVIDSGLIGVWLSIDPMHRHLENLTTFPTNEDEDTLYIAQVSQCQSHHMSKWLGTFYALKGLLLLFGVYMAWETRNVKIPVLNDSQYIGMNVYNVVITSVIVVALSNIMPDKPSLVYALKSTFLLLSTSLTLCLLFLPKVYNIYSSKTNPIVTSSGIVVDANTRRFLVNDRQDIYYRAQVQNRAYQKELIEMEMEVIRLENLLDIPLKPYPRLSEHVMANLPETEIDVSPEVFSSEAEVTKRLTSITECDATEEKIHIQVFSIHISPVKRNNTHRRASVAEMKRKLSELKQSLSSSSKNSRKQTMPSGLTDMDREKRTSGNSGFLLNLPDNLEKMRSNSFGSLEKPCDTIIIEDAAHLNCKRVTWGRRRSCDFSAGGFSEELECTKF